MHSPVQYRSTKIRQNVVSNVEAAATFVGKANRRIVGVCYVEYPHSIDPFDCRINVCSCGRHVVS